MKRKRPSYPKETASSEATEPESHCNKNDLLYLADTEILGTMAMLACDSLKKVTG